MNLVYKHEKKLHAIILVLSIIIWTVLLVGTFGAILFYMLLGFLLYLFTHSGFISYIKGNGVKLSENQFPELYTQYHDCCSKLNMKVVPEVYILNSDGVLNALATRFLKRHYVILYSSIVDALSKYPDGINFYIGHELGHIKRGHLNWTTLIWPGQLLPIIGAAYSRAREYTCDLHGLECCKQVKDAPFALAVLATGPEKWSKLNIGSYIIQTNETGSFWMSFHELTGDYPWLCKRMKHLVALGKEQTPEYPTRNPFAFLLALFVPRIGIGGGAGGLVSLVIVVAIIGVLAAVALPAYQDYTTRANVALALQLGEQIEPRAASYIEANGGLPSSLSDLGLSNDLMNSAVEYVEITDEGIVLNLQGGTMEGKTIILSPSTTEGGGVVWQCDLGSLESKYRPLRCR